MKPLKITSLLLLLSIIVIPSAFSQSTLREEVEKVRSTIERTGKDIDWELFDSTSKVPMNQIKPEDIQGLWKAYNGLFKFTGMVNSMILTQPLTIEIKGDKFRRSKDSKFEKFTLNKNQIFSKKENDFGVINKLSDRLLVITWKSNGNYTRYYYEK